MLPNFPFSYNSILKKYLEDTSGLPDSPDVLSPLNLIHELAKYSRHFIFRPFNCTVAYEPCKPHFKLKDYSDPESLDDDVIRNKILEANQLIDRVKQALNKIKAIKPCRKESAQAVSGESNPSSTDIEETINNLKRETELLITDDLDERNLTSTSKANAISSSSATSSALIKNQVTNSSLIKKHVTNYSLIKSQVTNSSLVKHQVTSSALAKSSATSLSLAKNQTVSSSLGKNLIRSSDQTGEASNNSIPHRSLKNDEEASSRSLYGSGLERSRKSSSEFFDTFNAFSRGEVDIDRPKTRRNESDDDLSEQLRKEKFRTRPESGRLEVSSSLEELEAKLQTISETTESNYSTPRKKSSDDENPHKCSNTDAPTTEEKEVQVDPRRQTAEVFCSVQSEEKSIQIKPSLMKSVKVVESSIVPEQKTLEAVNISPEEIAHVAPKCSMCKIECLPAWQLSVSKRDESCQICPKILKEENLPGVSIPSKMEKLQNLTIKILPPVIIKQPLILTQVLNLSIKPDGECANQVENTKNIGYVEVKASHIAQKLCDTILPPKNQNCDDDDDEENNGGVEEEQGNNDDEITWFDYNMSDEDKPIKDNSDDDGDLLNDAMIEESNAQLDSKQSQSIEKANENDEELFMNEVVSDYDYIVKEKFELDQKHDLNLMMESKGPNVFHTCYSFEKPEGSIATCDYFDSIKKKKEEVDDEDEESRKMLWYKSYHIFDNPNKHDPGTLDQKSLEKISQIDFEFYRNFINPNPTMSEVRFTPSESRNLVLGLESKTVQCNASSILKEVGSNRSPRKLNFVGLEDDKNKEDSSCSPRREDTESEVTLLNLSLDKFKSAKIASSSIMPKGLLRERSAETSSSSPSEITVTISYTASKESSNKSTDTKKSISEIHETEIKSVILDEQCEEADDCETNDGEAKLLTVADKGVINKLYHKLKSIDTRASQPKYTMKKDSQNCETLDNFIKGLTNFQETKKNSQDPETKSDENQKTVNYLLNDVSPHFDNLPTEHLELARNGRYRDEENMFAQFPYPTSCSKQHCDIQQPIKEPKTAKDYSVKPQDKEILKDKFEFIPRYKLKRYSPDTSNSDTVTTSSISEGEILCKHSVSNGEIHVCRHRPRCPRMRRNILSRRNLTHLPIHDSPLSFAHSVPKKFDLNDPSVTIEQRRNYFNHWVTYYVKPQDVHESSTSSCSNNNNKQ